TTNRHPSSSTLFPYTTLFRSWKTWSAQCERAVLNADADWFRRQANALDHRDKRTDAQKDRARFEAEVWRLLTVERVPERKILDGDRKSTRLNSSHEWISYAVF